MFDSVHNKLMQCSRTYSAWHSGQWWQLKNVSLLLLMSVMTASIAYMTTIKQPEYRGMRVLGAETERWLENIGPQIVKMFPSNEHDGLFFIQIETDTQSFAWIEYTSSNGENKQTTPRSKYGKSHSFLLQNLGQGAQYTYTIVLEDKNNRRSVSNDYFFQK